MARMPRFIISQSQPLVLMILHSGFMIHPALLSRSKNENMYSLWLKIVVSVAVSTKRNDWTNYRPRSVDREIGKLVGPHNRPL